MFACMDFSELPCRGPKLTLLGNAPSWVSSLVFKTFLDLVVLGMLVEPRQHLPRCRRHIRSLIILPGELPDRIPGVKPHNRNALYPGTFFSAIPEKISSLSRPSYFSAF